MTIQLSVSARNARLDSFETAAGASAKLQLRSGAQPANCAAAAAGTLLSEIALPADWMAAAASGSKAKSGTWSGTGAAGAGAGTDAGHFRVVDSAGTTCHMQGSVSISVDGAWAISTAYTAGQRVSNGGNVYTCTTGGTSAGTGTGPSGTGTGITDGTAVWDYVSALGDMTLDNINIANGQSITVNTFTLTDGNA